MLAGRQARVACTAWASVLLGLGPSAAEGQGAICARVTIQIDQKVIVTRTAFRGTLKIDNDGATSLSSIGVTVDIRDAEGLPANDRFAIDPPDLENLDSVSGDGTLAAESEGTARWLFIPTHEAAPSPDPATYFVGGELRYELDGTLVTVPLYPVEIQVLPDAELHLKYFLQSPVYSDNPFALPDGSNPVEPAEPFSLALLVRNEGYGAARNVNIISSQPEITNNDRSLLITFRIIGSQLWTHIDKVNDAVTMRVVHSPPVSPSLAVNLGDVQANESAISRWLMTSTLQGRFCSYDATFEHVNARGDKNISLIESVDIYELNHMVWMTGPGDDGLPDFLVNDPPADSCDNPETNASDTPPNVVHASDGTVVPVHAITSGSSNGAPSMMDLDVDLTVHASQLGWTFIRVDDPGAGAFPLGQVIRGTTKLLDGYNVWTTHRWLPVDDPPEEQQHRLYIFDYIDAPGPVTYTLMYVPGVEVAGVTINGGVLQRSNVESIFVRFTAATNVPSLITDRTIETAVTLLRRGTGGALNEVVTLSADRFAWDSLTNSLTIDLTADGFGGIRQTMLTDANYMLELDTSRILSATFGTNLVDGDGVADGIHTIGAVAGDGFFRFAGDGNGDRLVNSADETLVQNSWLKSSGQPGFDANADMNADGVVNSLDLQMVRGHWMMSLGF